MIARTKKPPKATSIYFALRSGASSSNIPTIKILEEYTIVEKSGSGGSATIQSWFAVRPNIHIGLIAGGIDFSQDDTL